jgi:hypothetical protein
MQLALCIVDSYETLYLEGPNRLQYPLQMMGGKLVLSLDKRDQNSIAAVMYDPFVGMIIAF